MPLSLVLRRNSKRNRYSRRDWILDIVFLAALISFFFYSTILIALVTTAAHSTAHCDAQLSLVIFWSSWSVCPFGVQFWSKSLSVLKPMVKHLSTWVGQELISHRLLLSIYCVYSPPLDFAVWRNVRFFIKKSGMHFSNIFHDKGRRKDIIWIVVNHLQVLYSVPALANPVIPLKASCFWYSIVLIFISFAVCSSFLLACLLPNLYFICHTLSPFWFHLEWISIL